MEKENAPAENRTRGPTMATLDFTTKPLARASIQDASRLTISCEVAPNAQTVDSTYTWYIEKAGTNRKLHSLIFQS